jgi:hypothetical protein
MDKTALQSLTLFMHLTETIRMSKDYGETEAVETGKGN